MSQNEQVLFQAKVYEDNQAVQRQGVETMNKWGQITNS